MLSQLIVFLLIGSARIVLLMRLDLPVYVFDLGLHVQYFGLKVKRIGYINLAHYLSIVPLLFQLHVDQENKLFMADRPIRVLI